MNKNKNKEYYDKNINPINFIVGDRVLMKNINKNDLKQQWLGPYEVIEIIKPINAIIKRNNKQVRVLLNHLKILKED